jgi:ATP-dependent Clp protease adaptor protein ClpS
MRILTKPEIDIDVLDDIEVEIDNITLWSLIVFNDEINTFDHVIETLMAVCDHTPEQAEQCTLLIHYKGKAAVKSGDFDELAAMRNAICQRQISAEVMLK